MKTITFTIHGMDCAEEIVALRREVGPLVGGDEKLGFDLLNGRMTATFANPAEADQEKIIGAVRRAGMTAIPIGDEKTSMNGDAADVTRRRLRLLTMVMQAGKDYFEEVVEKDGKPYLRAMTAVPVVMQKCVMCHAHYADAKKGAAIGAISYTLPID